MNDDFYNFYYTLNNKFSYTLINKILDVITIKSLDKHILIINLNGLLLFMDPMEI